ncbi:hypothetical protein BH09SUM1_BH09SUM1_09230 [soil metagenome]
MKIVAENIPIAEMRQMASDSFGEMVKAVADIELGLLAVDAEMHSDLEQMLLNQGSKQGDLWGINVYPDTLLSLWSNSIHSSIFGHGRGTEPGR